MKNRILSLLDRFAVLSLVFLLLFSFVLAGQAPNLRAIGVVAKDKAGKSQQVRIYGKSLALVIGIDRFADAGITQLRNAVRDARGVLDVLVRDYAFERVEGIFNEQATKAGILTKFNELGRLLTKDDALFVFIASHGVTVNDVGFVIPHDGSFSNPFQNLSMTEIKDVIAPTINAKHVFFVLDSCFSGSMLKRDNTQIRNGRQYEALVQMAREPVSCALTAGDAGQKVLDGGQGGHSVFTGRLIQALTDNKDYITASELAATIARNVVMDARDKRHDQTPRYGSLTGQGEFILIRKNASTLGSVDAELARLLAERQALEKQLAEARDATARRQAEEALRRKKADEAVQRRLKEELEQRERLRLADEVFRRQQNEVNRKAMLQRQEEMERIRQRLSQEQARYEALRKSGQGPKKWYEQYRGIRKRIADDIKSFEESRQRQIRDVRRSFEERRRLTKSKKKDMFEYQSEFDLRIRNELATLAQGETEQIDGINRQHDRDKAGAIGTWQKQLDGLLSGNRFFLRGAPGVRLTWGDFDEAQMAFPYRLRAGDLSYRLEGSYRLVSASSTERIREGREILSRIKADAYAGEVEYRLDPETGKPVVLYARIRDLTVGPNAQPLVQVVTAAGNEDWKLQKLARHEVLVRAIPEDLNGQPQGVLDNHKATLEAARLAGVAQGLLVTRQLVVERAEVLLQVRALPDSFAWLTLEVLRAHQALLARAEALGVPREAWEGKRQALQASIQQHMAPLKLVHVPGGSFDMGDVFGDSPFGDEKPVHRVTVSPFYLGKHEVTFAQYDAFCTATGRERPKDEGWGRDNRPVVNVSRADAIAFCNWLSKEQGLPLAYNKDGNLLDASGQVTRDIRLVKGYRLPTEAEWEYAAREGGKKVRFGNGKDILDSGDANFNAKDDNKKLYSVTGVYRGMTLPVGSFRPNSLGLYDMSGNVWEWCHDYKDEYNANLQDNPVGPASGVDWVIRGGSWDFNPVSQRVFCRFSGAYSYRYHNLGFRIARTP